MCRVCEELSIRILGADRIQIFYKIFTRRRHIDWRFCLNSIMKTIISTTTALLLSTILHATAEIIAGPITNPANGHDYYLLGANTWTASEAEAENLGGTLAVIRNAAEQEWVFSKFGSMEIFGSGCTGKSMAARSSGPRKIRLITPTGIQASQTTRVALKVAST